MVPARKKGYRAGGGWHDMAPARIVGIDGGWRRILRGTVTEEPGERGCSARTAGVCLSAGDSVSPRELARRTPFPDRDRRFPPWSRRPSSVAIRRPPWSRRPPSVAIRRPSCSRRPPSVAPHMPFRPPSYFRFTPFTAFSRHPMSATPTPAACFLIQRHQVSRQPILEHSNRKCLNDRYL